MYFYTCVPEPTKRTPQEYASSGDVYNYSVTKADEDMAEREFARLKSKPDYNKYGVIDRMGVSGLTFLSENLRLHLEEKIASLNSIEFGTVRSVDLHLACRESVKECFVCKERNSGSIYHFVHRLTSKIADNTLNQMNLRSEGVDPEFIRRAIKRS